MTKYDALVYALYHQPTVSLCDDGRLALKFTCVRPDCKRRGKPLNRYEHHATGPDNGSTGGLRHHVISCWGKAKLVKVDATKSKGAAEEKVRRTKQGTLTFLFGSGNSSKFTFSFKNHTPHEIRFVLGHLDMADADMFTQGSMCVVVCPCWPAVLDCQGSRVR